MIVIEGPDGAGKSTLVKTLQEEFGFAVGERATKNRDLLYQVTRQDTYTALSTEIRGDQMNPLIWDRLFWSELVYADIVGRDIEFTTLEQTVIKRLLSVLSLTIVCRPSLDTVLGNVLNEERHEMEGVKERIETIYDRYTTVFVSFPGIMLWYDYTDEQSSPGYYTYNEIVGHIRRFLAQRKERLWNPVNGNN